MKNMNIQLAETDFGKKGSNIALLLVAFGAVFFAILPAAYAQTPPPTPKYVASINLQGSNDGTPTPRGQSSTENKWLTVVLGLLRNAGGDAPMDIVAMQEAGAVPQTARDAPFNIANQQNTNWGGNVGDGPAAQAFNWNVGTATRPESYYIYWVNADRNGAGSSTRNVRVNLAIVTRAPAESVVTFYPFGAQRPVLAVLIDGTWYATAHARSGQNPQQNACDAPAIIAAAQQVFGRFGNGPFVTLADWNNEPGTIINTGARINALGGDATQARFDTQTAAVLTYPNVAPTVAYDYFVGNDAGIRNDRFARLTAGFATLLTDHRLVKYRFGP
jgi:hypothetical protein